MFAKIDMNPIRLNPTEQGLLDKISQDKSWPSNPEGYSHTMAWLLATMSEFVYRDFEYLGQEEVLGRTTKALNATFTGYDVSVLKTYNSGKTSNNHDTQALLIELPNCLVLVFRGTETDKFRDFKTIFDIGSEEIDENPNDDNEGRLHSGFHGAYEAVADAIQKDLNDLNSKLPLITTGHSLGGALAAIAAKRLKNKDKNRTIVCYTFGAPKIGDQNWVNKFPTPEIGLEPSSVPVYRVFNAIDAIPFLLSFTRYIHIGKIRYITRPKFWSFNRNETVIMKDYEPDGKDKRRASAFRPVPAFSLLPIKLLGFKEHQISRYRKRMAFIAKTQKGI